MTATTPAASERIGSDGSINYETKCKFRARVTQRPISIPAAEHADRNGCVRKRRRAA